MMKSVLCYKTHTPIYYNNGAQCCDTFLLWYLHGYTIEQAQALCDELNKNHPAFYHNLPIDWEKNNIEYLFVKEQEEMCG